MLTHARNPDQTMTVLANGTRIADLAVSVSGDRHVIVVPGDLVKEGLVRVVFRFAKWNPSSPSDGRARAVAFERLRVR